MYEDNQVFAFLDISPLSKGHFLVIPKAHSEKFHEISDETASAIIITIKKLTLALGIENYNILQNNGKIAHQAVFHVHFHVIPKKTTGEGLGISWKSISMNEEEFENIIQKIQLKL